MIKHPVRPRGLTDRPLLDLRSLVTQVERAAPLSVYPMEGLVYGRDVGEICGSRRPPPMKRQGIYSYLSGPAKR